MQAYEKIQTASWLFRISVQINSSFIPNFKRSTTHMEKDNQDNKETWLVLTLSTPWCINLLRASHFKLSHIYCKGVDGQAVIHEQDITVCIVYKSKS